MFHGYCLWGKQELYKWLGLCSPALDQGDSGGPDHIDFTTGKAKRRRGKESKLRGGKGRRRKGKKWREKEKEGCVFFYTRFRSARFYPTTLLDINLP